MSSNKFQLVDGKDPILKVKCSDWNFDQPYTLPDGTSLTAQEFAEEMGRLMNESRGIGLAAPQVGLPVNMLVVGDPNNNESTMAFFNPKIVDTFGEMVYYEEGCLSYPGLFIKIKRPAAIKLRFADSTGEITTTKYSGLTARVIQHEYDHLQGITYQSKANRIHMAKAKKDLKLRNRKLKKVS